eukprot:4450359-Pleurochrysis_carterae.AAC.5
MSFEHCPSPPGLKVPSCDKSTPNSLKLAEKTAKRRVSADDGIETPPLKRGRRPSSLTPRSTTGAPRPPPCSALK